ncbi:uncharacterized protein DDB_G0289357-like isoform X1 [Spodoptera frugiperda]|uniref:Uncharacterized protein DDB_G0289357-like isoform X1 n=1 Tax=Spodoptera frugiperda TaxID=7108 RepID=A0A9R0D988_SPOFR|nr:uncharacterized protein DDB_G0289357-like isoform X1 [Spodoptera frugiperda]
MGCTSSAPNMANSSKSEKSIQFEEDASDVQSRDTEEIIYRAGNDTDDTNELPPCDNLSEHNINVVRNISTSSLKTEKDNQEDRHSSEMILNKTVSSATLHEEESPPKLEEVVEKVVELHSSEDLNEIKPENKHDETAGETENNDNDKTKESNIQDSETHDDEKQDTQNVDGPEEATSPSQSESSRATRWEALADIAAELPPSLTVDPVTGQIYALSK